MRRRDFITVLGGAAAGWPLAARAQQPRPLIGFLSAGSRASDLFRLNAFQEGLRQVGYIEGTNVSIEYRSTEGRNEKLVALAADFMSNPVDVIAAAGVAPAMAAKAAGATTPIVFVTGVDPVVFGLVASLSRPGGNVTGITDLTTELGPKHLELLQELLPMARSFALLINPSRPDAALLSQDLQEIGRRRDLKIDVVQASTERDLERVFATITQLHSAGLVVSADALFNSMSEQLAAMAAHQRLPAIHVVRQFVVAGGLIAYGGGLTEAYRQAGVYAGRLLKGEKAADLPVQQSTKVELFLNLKTAKALGLDIPATVLARADEVIE